MPISDLLEAELLPSAEYLYERSIPDFSGSLSYIDSLASRSPISLKSGLSTLGRNADVISKAVAFNNLQDEIDSISALPRGTTFLVDNRYFNPMTDFDPGELTPGAGRLQDSLPPPDWKRWEKIERKFRRQLEPGFNPLRQKQDVRIKPGVSFTDALRMAICIKRKLRRVMMFVNGKAGFFYRAKYYNPYSFVRC